MGLAHNHELSQLDGLLACLQTDFVNLLQSLGHSDTLLLPLPDSPKATLGSTLPITDLFPLLGMMLS